MRRLRVQRLDKAHLALAVLARRLQQVLCPVGARVKAGGLHAFWEFPAPHGA